MKNKVTLLLLSCLIFTFSCRKVEKSNLEKTTSEFLIKGVVPGLNNQAVFLKDLNNQLLASDSARNGEFIISGKAIQQTVFLTFENSYINTPIFLNANIYNIRFQDYDTSQLVVISNNKKQQAYHNYLSELYEFDKKLFAFFIKKQETSDLEKTKKFKKEISVLLYKKQQKTINFITENKNSPIALYELRKIYKELKKNQLKKIYATLDTTIKTGKMASDIEQLQNKHEEEETMVLAEREKTKPYVPERVPAPLFSGLSPEGYTISLSSITGVAKVTLLDFWGSWCQPCRDQNPFLVRLYKKYHNKGFDILGIAEETSKSRPNWETAIRQDGLSWHHIVDENYSIASMYGVHSVPHAVLIDNKGKIIYSDARGRDVEYYLSEHLDGGQ